MARPAGSRNAGYERRRNEIAARLASHLGTPDGARASLRELAAAAEVSVSTLRHYFGDRDGALVAAMAELRRQGEPWMEVTRCVELHRPLADSLRWYLGLFAVGWEQGVGAFLGQSFAAGMHHETLGPAMVTELLEPTLQAAEARLAHYQRVGELDPEADLRHAAIDLVAPVLVALLHQGPLGGARCRPLDVDRLVEDHVERFVRAWGTR